MSNATCYRELADDGNGRARRYTSKRPEDNTESLGARYESLTKIPEAKKPLRPQELFNVELWTQSSDLRK